MKVQENQRGLELNDLKQLLVMLKFS